MTWIEDIFHKKKAVIGLCHLKALPGDPLYDPAGGMEGIYRSAKRDVEALQEGGIDGIQFTNEFSVPYDMNHPADPAALSAMAEVIGRLKDSLTVPFGCNYIGDSKATIGLCTATGAKWTRGTYYGTWATNDGLLNADCAEIYRLRHNLGNDQLKLVHYIVPESSADIGGRDPVISIKSHYFLNKPDALGICGLVAGQKIDVNVLHQFRTAYPDAVLFVTTGITPENIKEMMQDADACFVGTWLKKDHVFTNEVDVNNVRELMECMRKEFGK
jgi:membrane complex biogenesis BtpA family protein